MVSLKVTLLFLNPKVFTLAILFPMTSSFVWKLRIPLMAEYMERNMAFPPDLESFLFLLR